ncbi:hypothetical protein [Leuconostoc mesenteroides]|uniref:hypothetical protein n=1 Tax=Leuconostoc mesenteroides TaxID=1245 RepID=UPI0021A7E46C|nr:hypothetical protein [Leuconostoc mesenteroides]MCT3053925.1 hypothetical protein [Leuconostoc mesenteroides]
MFKNFNIENWLTFATINLSVITSAGSFIASLWFRFVDEREKNRPIIFISFHKYHENGFLNTELKIKNYGISVGWIKEIEISPLFEAEKNSKLLDPNGFTKFKNFPLAPQQEISFLIAVGEGAAIKYVEDRRFVIKYEAHFATKLFSKKKYVDNYLIDDKNYPMTFSDGHFTEEYRLKQIHETLKGKKY